MARRKKRRVQKKGSTKKLENKPEVILALAEKLWTDGKMARAREGFKRLFKLEPEIYRERFIQVTKLAISEAISAGKSTQARQWLDHLKNELALSVEHLKIEELKLASSLGDQSARDQLAHFQFISDDEEERRAGADTLVLAQANEAKPVCLAITHLCRSEWNEMREALQGIGRKSPFAHWRLFLRGCAAYYQNDHNLAQSCFSKLPPNSVPSKKSEAFSDWSVKEVKDVSESTIKQACQLIGEPQMGDAIIKSHDFWDKRKYFKAYETMKLSDTHFPEWNVSLSGQLTSFFQQAYAAMPLAYREAWYDTIVKMLRNSRFQTPENCYLLSNSSIHSRAGEFEDIWNVYRENRQLIRGLNPRFNALCFVQQADSALVLDCDCEDCLDIANRDAESYLLKAIEENSGYETAYTKLLELYQKTEENPKRNKLLDEMIQRFPESTTALLEAASACLDRKSYVKGLKYLEKARAASPLDQQVTSEIRRGLLGKAIAHYAKGSYPQIEKARATFEQLLQEKTNSPSILESRDLCAVQWCALEEVMLKKKDSLKDEKLALAKGMAPHVLKFTLNLYREIYNNSLNQRRLFKPISLGLKGKKTLAQAVQITQILLFEVQEKKSDVRMSWLEWVEKYANQSLSQLTKNDRETAIAMYNLLDSSSGYWTDSPSKLIKKWLKIDKNDPLFLIWKIESVLDDPTAKQINQIRNEAEKRGDQLALTTLSAYLKRHEDFDKDEYEDFDEEDYDEAERAEEAKIIMILESMAVKERIGFLVSQGIPKRLAREIANNLELFSSQKHTPPRDSKPKKKKTPPQQKKPAPRPVSKPLSDPNQSEFPF